MGGGLKQLGVGRHLGQGAAGAQRHMLACGHGPRDRGEGALGDTLVGIEKRAVHVAGDEIVEIVSALARFVGIGLDARIGLGAGVRQV